MKKAILFSAISLLLISCKKDSPSTVSYSKVSITKLTVLAYPDKKPSGADWDNALAGYYPDVYFDITKSGTTETLYSLDVANRKENMTQADLPVSWSTSSGSAFFTLTNLSQAVDVDLYDFDSLSADEYMGTATFNFQNYTSGSNRYPSTITATSNGVSIKLNLTWIQ